MLLKNYEMTDNTAYLTALQHRASLTEDEQKVMNNYYSGYKGEAQFYHMIKEFDAPVIWDLTLYHHDYVQYDFLIVMNGCLYHFDVKNYGGQYRMEKDVMIHLQKNKVFKHPLTQLERAHQLLQYFVADNGFNYTVVSRIIFINDQMMIKGYDGDERIIFAGQLPQIVKYMKTHDRVTDRDLQLAQVLKNAQVIYPYTSFNRRGIEELNTSLRCFSCRRLLTAPFYKKYTTCSCGYMMKREDMALQNLYELERLKGEHISKREAMQWTGYSNSAIKRFLSQHADKEGVNRGTKYVMKKK